MWGALMGLGTLLVVTVSSLRPEFSQSSWVGHWLWGAIALLNGFVLYQGLIVLAYPMMAGGHFMGWQIIVKLLLKQVTWGGAIALGHGALLWQHLSHLRPSQG